jgi:hypothetical protein
MEIALVIALVLSNLAFLAALLTVLGRVDSFMREAMVYMKSNNISDVLSASSLLKGKPNSADDAMEVVPGQDDEEALLLKTQEIHRNRHLKSLGAE